MTHPPEPIPAVPTAASPNAEVRPTHVGECIALRSGTENVRSEGFVRTIRAPQLASCAYDNQ